ncbi:MAG: chemoreceptor glutamine deamidase CheD [Comamonas sp.]
MKAFGPDALARTHYFDADQQCDAVKLLPNEYYVARAGAAPILLTTVLGSCVAACLRDRVSGAGGMNHFMLPGNVSPAEATMRYGSYAMEVLINEILKAGGVRERLEAKVFGGGAVLSQMTHLAIGDSNAEFILDYLRAENIPVLAQDLRGTRARRVNYFPADGRAMVRKLGGEPEVQAAEVQEAELQTFFGRTPRASRIERLQPRAVTGGVERLQASTGRIERLRPTPRHAAD